MVRESPPRTSALHRARAGAANSYLRDLRGSCPAKRAGRRLRPAEWTAARAAVRPPALPLTAGESEAYRNETPRLGFRPPGPPFLRLHNRRQRSPTVRSRTDAACV